MPYCGDIYCSESTICGYESSELQLAAITGIAICGKTICGYGIPIEDTILTPQDRNVNALIKIFKSSGSTYTLNLVSCNINLCNPSNDMCSVEAIDYNILEMGDRVQIWLGSDTKYLMFIGDIIFLTHDETGITKFSVESLIDRLKYRYLKSDVAFTSDDRASVASYILSGNSAGLSYDINYIKGDPSFLLTKEYWAWDMTIFDILVDLMWDHNIYYTNKTLYITSPDIEVGYNLNYHNNKFKSWSVTEEKGNQFYLIHVDGSEHYIDKYTDASGLKEISYNQMTATTQAEVNRIANILASEENKTLYNVQVTMPYIMPPLFGKMHIVLPGLNENLIITEISYSVNGNNIETIIKLGSHRNTLSSIISKLAKESKRSHFIY